MSSQCSLPGFSSQRERDEEHVLQTSAECRRRESVKLSVIFGVHRDKDGRRLPKNFIAIEIYPPVRVVSKLKLERAFNNVQQIGRRLI